jgi:hypothetical protein
MITEALQTQRLQIENEKALLKIQYAENESTPIEFTRIQFFQKINSQFISSFKSITVSISITGLLTRLADNIGLYRIATTDINISKEEAIKIAMREVQPYASQHQQNIIAVNATLEYVRDITSNCGDSFTIYPQWNVFATFDKINEENVIGYAVLIWADNGKVYHSHPQGLYSPSQSNSTYPPWLPAVATAAIFAALSGLVYTKHYQTKSRRKGG